MTQMVDRVSVVDNKKIRIKVFKEDILSERVR